MNGFRFAAVAAVFALVGVFPDAAAEERPGAYQLNPNRIATDVGYSSTMIDRQDNVTNKVSVALRARQDDILLQNRLYLGGRVFGSVIHENTNSPGKYPILSRLPPTH